MIQLLEPVAASKAIEVADSVQPPYGSFSMRWIDSTSELEAIEEQWECLFHNAIWKNVSFTQNVLIPAFKHLGDGRVRVLVIESRSAPDRPSVICGLMPVIKKSFYHLPISVLEAWKHDQCFDTTPLIRSDCAVEVLKFIFTSLAEQNHRLLSLDTVSAENEFQTALDESLNQLALPRFNRDSFGRAALRPLDSVDDYMNQHVSKSAKRNVRRLERRLADEGVVSFELSDQESDFDQLTRDFLAIEASGWKGESGTALACDPSEKSFYEEMISRSAKLGRARFLTLRIDCLPIAMLSDLESDGIIYSYKTAFDDTYSAFSPGLQAELKNIEFMHQHDIEFADSCTSPDNATINRIWGQELKFQSLVVGLRPGLASLAIRLMPQIQSTVRRLRSLRS